MRQRLLQLLYLVLRKLSQLTILRYRPAIVGVTGSVGKTSTKLAIAAVLASERTVRAARGNFNGEVGLPLTILGDWKNEELKLLSRETPPGSYPIKKALFLAKVILVACYRLIAKGPYPEILVLEYGIDRPGDMRYLLTIARPNVAVLTAIGETPAHVEFFESPKEVVREKARLIESLTSSGFAVLNADDPVIMGLKLRTRAQIMTYGFDKGASVEIGNFENRAAGEEPKGISFKLAHGGHFVPARLDGIFGKSNAYAAGAAAAVGTIFGINLLTATEALAAWYRPAPHRMELLRGARGSWVIDDCYNAGPLSMRAALDTLIDLPAKRRIAVLGDMLEIGEYAAAEHEKIGRLLAKDIDVLVTVGARARFIAEGAAKAGMKKKNIESFETAEEARSFVKDTLKKGDLVLIKASRAMHLEQLVHDIRSLDGSQVSHSERSAAQ